jgi:DNA-binding transcriptional MerR regulator
LNKAPDAFRTISEVADDLDLPQHVLRFWESRFPHIKPMKRGGGRRYYRPEDVDLLRGIRHLLYGDGYTIRGVQRILREQGVRTVQSVGQGHAVSLPAQSADDGPDEGEAENPRGFLKFLPPRFSDGAAAREADEPGAAESEVDEDIDAPEPDASSPGLIAPQKRPKVEANSPPVPQGAKAPPVSQAPLDAAADLPALPAPAPHGLAAGDLDRLRAALAELEACRRLLDKANEGGR